MKRHIVFVVIILMVTAVACPLVAEEDNLSQGRTLGIGMQVGSPWGGLVSTRYWFSEAIGVEGITLFWGEIDRWGGTATARLLYRIGDTSTVDFYVAAGGSVPLSSDQTGTQISFSTVAGIEFTLPVARHLALNAEFGAMVSTEGRIGMAGGVGLHFYF